MRTVTFQKDTPIFREGQPGDCMYEVMRGAVGIYAGWGTPEQRMLTQVVPGKPFGEMAIVEDAPRSADAVATQDDTTLLEISEADLQEYFRASPERIMLLLRNLSNRLRSLTQEYTEVRNAIAKAEEKEQAKKAGLFQRLRHFAGIYDRRREERKAAKNLKYTPPEYADAEGRMVEYGENSIIFVEGEKSRELYIVRGGSVGIYTGYGHRDEKLLVTLEPGSYFGEMSMIEEEPRSATAVALSAGTKLERIRPEDVDSLLESTPEVVLDIFRTLSARLRKLTQDYLEACRAAGTVMEAVDKNRAMDEEAKKLISYYASSQTYTNYI